MRSIDATSPEAGYYFSRYTLPLGLKTKKSNMPWDDPTRRATFTLIRTRDRHIFVTCCHVLEALRDLETQDPDAEIVAYQVSAPVLVELNGFEAIDKER